METDIYHQDETPIAADDREYQHLYSYAAGAYAAEEAEAWQMACANGVTVTTPISNPPARQGEGT